MIVCRAVTTTTMMIPLLLLATLLGGGAAHAEEQRLETTEKKKREATKKQTRRRELLDEKLWAQKVLGWATDAVGGKDALMAVKEIAIESSGETFAAFEGVEPASIVKTQEYERTPLALALNDDDGGAVDKVRVDESLLPFFATTFDRQNTTRIVNGLVGGSTNSVMFWPGGTARSQSVSSLKRQQTFANPHVLLRKAHLQPSCLFYRRGKDGRHVLGIKDDVSDILLVVKRSGRITRLRTMEANSLIRDLKITVRYKFWNVVSDEGIVFPRTVSLGVNWGTLWTDNRRSVRTNPNLPNSTFDLPEGTDPDSFDPVTYEWGTQSHHMIEQFRFMGFFFSGFQFYSDPVEIANGVYFLFGSNVNSVIVSYGEGVILQEAPGSQVVADDYLDRASELFPGAPITHHIQSHHHVDHASGCRQVMAKTGATLVVANGITDFWNFVFEAESSIRPDEQHALGNPLPAILEVPEPNATLTVVETPDIKVSVLDNGFDPTVADAILTTIEIDGQMFLFQSDLYAAGFGPIVPLDPLPSLFDAMRYFGIIDENCDAPPGVDLFIIPAHGFVTSLEDALIEIDSMGVDIGC